MFSDTLAGARVGRDEVVFAKPQIHLLTDQFLVDFVEEHEVRLCRIHVASDILIVDKLEHSREYHVTAIVRERLSGLEAQEPNLIR